MANFARGNPARWWKSRSCGGASRAPRALYISRFRRWAGIITLLFFIALFAAFWYFTNPARISRMSESLFSRVLGGKVKVRTGRLSLSGTLLLSGVEVRTADQNNSAADDPPIFSAENVEVRIDWFSLLSGHLKATQLVADTPIFRPIEDHLTGGWNYERMNPNGLANAVRRTPGETKSITLPVIILRNAHVRWGELRDNHLEITGETIIEGDLTPDISKPSLYRFQFYQMAGSPASGTRQEIGALLRGTLDTAANTFSAVAENVTMSETLKNGLPRVAREWCDEHHLEGKISRLAIDRNDLDGTSVTLLFQDVGLMAMVEPENGVGMAEIRPSYPVDIRNVSGQVTFLSSGGVHIENLTGEVLKYRFVADCDMQSPSFDDPYKLKIRFPDANLRDPYPPIFMAFLLPQDLIARVAPHGRMDIAIDLERTKRKADPIFNGRIDLHDAQMRYAFFPYPLDHLQGYITFDRDYCTFHHVTAKGDLNDVTIDGSTGINWAHRAIDFTVSSDNLYFDDRLAATLPDKYRQIWDLFNIRAHGGFVCRVTRSNNIGDLPKVVVDVTVDDGTGYIKDQPFVFRKAAGKLRFEGDQTRIERLTATTGADNSGNVVLDGVVKYPGGDVSHLNPELHVKANVPIDDQLLNGFREEISEKLKDLSLGGRVAFDGMVRRAADVEKGVQVSGEVAWSDGTLKTPLGGGLELTGITAEAALTPTSVQVKRFETTLNVAAADSPVKSLLPMTLTGVYDIETGGGTFNVAANAKDFTLPGRPAAFMPAEWAEKWQSFAPAGIVDLHASAAFRFNPPGSPAPTAEPLLKVSDTFLIDGYSIAFDAHGISLSAKDWPDPIKNLTGHVNIAPDKITMSDMAAVLGDVSPKWSGEYVPSTGALSLTGSATSKGYPEHYLSHLPDAIRNNLDLKRDGVTLSLQLESLTRAGTDKPWAFKGVLDAENVGITGPIISSARKLRFTGAGTYDPGLATNTTLDPFSYTGTFSAEQLLIASHVLDSLESSVETSASKHEINIADIQGKVAEGVLHGNVLVHLAHAPAVGTATLPAAASQPMVDWSNGGYQADLMLNDASLPLLMLQPDAKEEEKKKVGTGRVFGSLAVIETFGLHADRTGRGELAVRDATIYNVPLSMGLMQIATLRLPVAKSFNSATMSYYLRNNEISFEKILLQSNGINIAGLGTVTLPEKKMELSFVTESPHELIIPVITPIIAEFRNELMQLSVTGTIDSPIVTPVPLSGISNTLKNLLPQRAETRAGP